MPRQKPTVVQPLIPPEFSFDSEPALAALGDAGLFGSDKVEWSRVYRKIEAAKEQAKANAIHRNTGILATLTFVSPGKRLKSNELATFFQMFAWMYSSGVKAENRLLPNGLLYEDKLRLVLPPPDKDANVTIESLSFNSPLEVALLGTALGLIWATIFSGGEIEFGVKGVRARIGSLGSGITALRHALQPIAVRASDALAEVNVKTLRSVKSTSKALPSPSKPLTKRRKATVAKKVKGSSRKKPKRSLQA